MQTTSDKQVNYNLCFIDYTKAYKVTHNVERGPGEFNSYTIFCRREKQWGRTAANLLNECDCIAGQQIDDNDSKVT